MRDRYVLGPMRERGLEQAITQPAQRAGLSIEPDLVSDLLWAQQGPGALPWISLGLRQAWETRTGDALTMGEFQLAGGYAVDHAQSAYDALTETHQDTARHVFRQLTQLTWDRAQAPARPVVASTPATWGSLYANVKSPEINPVLDILADKRIITLTGDGAEISLALLPAAWPLLRDSWPAEGDRQDPSTEGPARAVIDIETREGELFLVVTDPAGLRSARPVSWAGGPGRRLLVARDATGAAPVTAGGGPARAVLTDAVDQGHASRERLAEYGQLLFEAAFGHDLWQRLLEAAAGQPYLELAIRGADSDDQTAMQALRWEALHDDTAVPIARGEAREGSPSVNIVRVLPDARQPTDTVTHAELQPIAGVPRLLFAVDSSLDGLIHADYEIANIIRQLDQHGVSVQARVLESALLPAWQRLLAILPELAAFRPDVLHLISRRPPPGEQGPDDEWATVEDLLSGEQLAGGHAPLLVVLSASQTATASRPLPADSARDHADVLSVGAQVVAAGVPVVIAMAGDIGDGERRAFTEALMASVLQGMPLAQAMTAGRQAAWRDTGLSATHWTLPTVFLAEHVRSDKPLVDPEVAAAVAERIGLLGLAQEPRPFGRSELTAAMDRLLDGGDRLSALAAYTPDQGADPGDVESVRELAAYAVRAGVFPLLLAVDGDPPANGGELAAAVSTAMQKVRTSIGLAMPLHSKHDLLTRMPLEADALRVANAIRLDLSKLESDLRERSPTLAMNDPVRTRAMRDPQVMLVCHGVDRWQDSFAVLLQMLDPTGRDLALNPVPEMVKYNRRKQWPEIGDRNQVTNAGLCFSGQPVRRAAR